MSDIQSISQGNYILQGTVATSAGIVGDGTPQNPLRADETVLWENSAGVAGGNFPVTISDYMSAYDRIRFEWDIWNEGAYTRTLTEVKPINNKFVLDSFYWNTQNNNLFYFAYPFVLNDLSLSFSADGKYKNLGTTATTANAGRNAFKLYGITGINRKAQ